MSVNIFLLWVNEYLLIFINILQFFARLTQHIEQIELMKYQPIIIYSFTIAMKELFF